MFVDLDLWSKNEAEAEHQRKYIDETQPMVFNMAQHKVVGCLVPIDQGNAVIRKAFGVEGDVYPEIVLFYPRDGRYAVYEHTKA